MQRTRSTADYDGAIDFLLSRIDYERMLSIRYDQRDLKLERMHELVERLGNPERAMPIVHVAGTKGKGSTSAMTAAMLSAAGYRTGLYTSPHLARLEERMTVDGGQCFARRNDRPGRPGAAGGGGDGCRRPAVASMGRPISKSSRRWPCSILPGDRSTWRCWKSDWVARLDSTNICQPLVSVITSISFDHTRQLGNTLAAIAGEKAGIIKPGAAVISGVTQSEPREVVAAAAERHGCRLLELGRDFSYTYHAAGPLDVAGVRPTIDFEYRVGRFAIGVSGFGTGLDRPASRAPTPRWRWRCWWSWRDRVSSFPRRPCERGWPRSSGRHGWRFLPGGRW